MSPTKRKINLQKLDIASMRENVMLLQSELKDNRDIKKIVLIEGKSKIIQ